MVSVIPAIPNLQPNPAWAKLPLFNHSGTALRACAFLQSKATMQVVSEAKGNMAGRCKVRVTTSELRISRVFTSTFEIQHWSFSPPSNQSGTALRGAQKERRRPHRRTLIGHGTKTIALLN